MKKGSYFTCIICGKEFYRSPSQIKNGSTKTCSRKCLGISFKGENNPFWGKTHKLDTKEKISNCRKGKCLGNSNALGYKHTEEARKRISIRSKEMWNTDREKILQALPRGKNHRFYKEPELRRYRKQFTIAQRRDWIDDVCAYCGTTENLELDHIIPIFDGGINIRENAQTLCRGCNLFKVQYVDLPRYYSNLATSNGADS